MTLAAGTRLGTYEILALIGAGGMGEVYRASDERLGRGVAIKVLPRDLAGDPDRLRRFEKEARSASALNHPNIVTIHEVGRHEAIPWIAMELVDGVTLREKLSGGALPAKQVLAIGVQIADGLARAHAAGIVHRDLKPENVMVTRDGLVKILDFGLAKLTHPELDSGQATHVPTESLASEAGAVKGTVAYMSPEQVVGKPIDFRSDQFSLGVVLYEMLGGRRPFHGASAAETLAAVIREDPKPIASLAPGSPAPLRWILERCLSKDPEDRYSSTRDLAKELRSLQAHLSETSSAADITPDEAPRLRRVPVWTLAIAPAIAVAFGLFFGTRFLRPGSPAASPLSLTLAFPVDAAPDTHNAQPLALSPDGRTLVYVGLKGGGRQLFVRPLDREEIRPIPGTDDARLPFFSPDGLWVGFFAEKKLKKVALAGGSPITLCDAPRERGGSWGADGTIVFTPTSGTGLQRIPASGGEPTTVTKPDAAKGLRHAFPQILPDGENVLFMVVHGGRRFQAAVVSLRTSEQRIVMEDAAYPRYLPTGHLVFARRGVLLAVPFSLRRLEASGPAVPLLEDVLTNRNFLACTELACSQDGTLVYAPYRPPQRTLVWVDRKGAIEGAPLPPAGYQNVALSPDGGLLATVSIGKAEETALLFGDFARRTLTRSGAEGSFDTVAWEPDGRRIAFGFSPELTKMHGVFSQSFDASAPIERLTGETVHLMEAPTSFSPDGTALLVRVLDFTRTTEMRWETFVLSLVGERTRRPLLQTRFGVLDARFSPDGRWVAYKSDESGRWEVYVQPHPGPGPRWRISAEGGDQPRWCRSGRELFYRQGDKIMAVDVETKPTFRAGRPRALLEGRYFSTGSDSYDVSPDGTRFLMIGPDPEESGPAHVKVVLNWFEEVKRRSPP